MGLNGKIKNMTKYSGSEKLNVAFRKSFYLILLFLFLIAVVYFLFFGEYVFFYQEKLHLFIYSKDYLLPFTLKPGGLLEYAGIFLTQGYYNEFYGSLLFSAILVLFALIFKKISMQISCHFFMIPVLIIPSCILLLLQTNFSWLLQYNLGFLLTFIYFSFSLYNNTKIRIISILLFPLFYYLAGGYALIFLIIYLTYFFVFDKWVYPVALLAVAVFSFLIFKQFLFLQPDTALITNALPSPVNFGKLQYLYIVFIIIVFYPLGIKIVSLLTEKRKRNQPISLFPVIVIFLATIFFLIRQYDTNVANLFRLEKYLYRQDWNSIIKHQEKHPIENLNAQYYYNIALAEKGILCDRMFHAPQDYGTQSIIIPWDSKAGIHNIFRGVYFYYTIGLINEAHRWAFEAMVSLGYRPEILKMLVKTNLINGYYDVARKYIKLLKQTILYKDWAEKYENMLDKPELIKNDSELGEKILLQPKKDFLIRLENPQSNILLMLDSNSENKIAFEYKMAWLLLEKNLKAIVNETNRFQELGYNKLPRHIEEAVVISRAYGDLFGNGSFHISKDVIDKYSQYETLMTYYRGRKPGIKFKNDYSDTYWYYLDYH